MAEEEGRWIMMSDGTPQTLYVGKTKLTTEEIIEARSNNELIEITEGRVMRTVILPTPEGINQSNMLMPNSIARRGLTHYVMPASFFWPDECDATMEVLKDQIKKCEGSEVKHRLKQAGLVGPDGGTTPDGMRRLQ